MMRKARSLLFFGSWLLSRFTWSNNMPVLIYIASPANSLKDFKSTFDRSITFLRWGSTNGLRFFLQFWYAKRPLFWIPRGLVPRYVEWILAFPRAPTGSVSIQMWGIACATVVQLVGAAVVAVVVLLGEYRQGQGTEKGREKMAMGAGGGDGGGRERKKEL